MRRSARVADPRGRRAKLRAVILARVSTLKRSQDKSGPRQLAELRELAARRGWPVVAELSERVSGDAAERPGLTAALELLEHHRAEVLIVHEMDRLGRNVPALLATAERIQKCGANLCFRDLPVDTTSPEGRLHFVLLAGLAEYGRRSNVAKVLSGLANARKKGVRLGRPPIISKEAIDLAERLRRSNPPASWAAIAGELRASGLGDFGRTSISSAVKRRRAKA